MTIRDLLIARLTAAARVRGLNADTPQDALARFVAGHLSSEEGIDRAEGYPEGEAAFGRLVRDVRRRLRAEGQQ